MTETPITSAPTEAEMAMARRLYVNYASAKVIAECGTLDSDWCAKVMAGSADDTHGVKIALAAIRETTEAAAKLADQQALDFLSPEYATGQPFSSFQERFACSRIAEALRANHHLPKGPDNG